MEGARHQLIAELARRLPEVESVVQRGRGFGKLVAETAATDAALVGVDEVGVPVAVGVVHLDDDRRLLAGPVAHAAVRERAERLSTQNPPGGHHPYRLCGLCVDRAGGKAHLELRRELRAHPAGGLRICSSKRYTSL